MLARDPAALELRADPAALAPERLLVFEVRGSIAVFAKAVSRVPGLELIDEEELPSDEDAAPVAWYRQLIGFCRKGAPHPLVKRPSAHR